MATKKKVKKATPKKKALKKAAPRGNPVKKPKASAMLLEVIENPIKGYSASVSVSIVGDENAIVAGIIATMEKKEEFRKLIEKVVVAYFQSDFLMKNGRYAKNKRIKP